MTLTKELASDSRLIKKDQDWEGSCPRCQRPIRLSAVILNDNHWTGEIICGAFPPHKFTATQDESGDVLLAPAEPAHASPQQADLDSTAPPASNGNGSAALAIGAHPQVNGLTDRIDEIDERLQQFQAKCVKMLDSLESAQTISLRKSEEGVAGAESDLAKLTRDIENKCSILTGQIAKTDDVSAKHLENIAAAVEQVHESAAEHAHLVKELRDDFSKHVVGLNNDFKTMRGNIQVINKDLNNCLLRTQAAYRAAAIPNVDPALLAERIVASKRGVPLDATNLERAFREVLHAPETISKLSSEFASGFTQGLERIRAYEELPQLFDVFERELNSWKNPRRQVPSEAVREGVVDVLAMLLRLIEEWQLVHGLVAYGAAGEKYDYAIHDLYENQDTNNADDFDTIKEVVYRGYRLKSDNSLLRRARVIIWTKPRAGV